jgi:hypothetical protein
MHSSLTVNRTEPSEYADAKYTITNMKEKEKDEYNTSSSNRPLTTRNSRVKDRRVASPIQVG